MSDPADTAEDRNGLRARGAKYAYMRRDGTLDIVLGSLLAGLGAYAYQFIGGHTLGAEAFAPISVLLTVHFLVFVVVLLPIEQLVIRRITLGRRGWVVPVRAVLLTIVAAVLGTLIVASGIDQYLDGDATFLWFVLATVATHFFFAVGRGYLAGFRRFRDYGAVSAAASLLRLVIAILVAIFAASALGFAWAQVLGPLVIVLWRPWRAQKGGPRVGSKGALDVQEAESLHERGLLAGLVLASAASQALLLAGPLVAGALGATAIAVSTTFATFTLLRAPLTLGYNLIARVLPPFTEMAARGERQELRAWARGMTGAGVGLAIVGGLAGAALGPTLVTLAFGDDFEPAALVTGLVAAGVVLAASALFVGQILVARGQPARLAVAWAVALAAAAASLALPATDPVSRVALAFFFGEAVALVALLMGALLKDREEGEVSAGYLVMKRSLDIGAALALLVLTSPILLVAALAVRLDSPGPAVFRQQRSGRHGNPFWMVKLRTMVIHHDEEVFRRHLRQIQDAGDAEEVYTIKIEDDPRITRVGSLLRRWSLDELPNLWNVLKGQMSLVGPRPLVPAEAELIGLDTPRFTVRPGITGLAQVRGRDALAADERTAYDEEYVETRTLGLDLKILAATLVAVFKTPEERER